MADYRDYTGGCHCGAVRFRFRAEIPIQVVHCNCSICRMTGYQHVLVQHDDVSLLNPSAMLLEYTFNTGTARHWFCKTCGIKSYYQPRSHPDSYSVNFRCLDDFDTLSRIDSGFDGVNWEENIDALRKAD